MGCGCQASGCGCQEGGGGCGCHHEPSASDWAMDPHSEMLLGLADEAWSKLMKEKMKAEWERTRGKEMDKAAAAAVQMAMAYWEAKMQKHAKKAEQQEKFRHALGK